MLQLLSQLRHKCAIGFVRLPFPPPSAPRHSLPSLPRLTVLKLTTLTPTGRRLGPRQATRAARHALAARNVALRLLLRGKRPHRLPTRGAAGQQQLHRVAGRGQVQAARQLLPRVYRRHRYSDQAGDVY